jgi:hypothetical protein
MLVNMIVQVPLVLWESSERGRPHSIFFRSRTRVQTFLMSLLEFRMT